MIGGTNILCVMLSRLSQTLVEYFNLTSTAIPHPVRVPDYDLKHAVSEKRLLGMWRLMTGFRLTYIGAALSLGVAALAKAVTFVLLQYLVDDVLTDPARPYDQLPLIALGFIGLALFEGGFTFWSGRLASRTAEGITLRLRNYLFDHVQRLTFAYHAKAQTGDLIQRSTSDVDAVRRFFADQAIGLGRIILLFGVNWITLMMLDWRLGLLSLICIPFIIGLSLFFFQRISKRYEEYQEQDAVTTTILQENLSGVRVVKAFARQSYERGKYDTANTERFQRGKRFMMLHAVYWPLTDLICGAQIVGSLFIVALMVINGDVTLGTYLAFVGLLIQIINPMRNLGRIIVHMTEGLVSFQRLLDILREVREPLTDGIYQPLGNVQGALSFQNVSFVYPDGGGTVLHGITFECQPGQRIALLGGTGSGKTTLVNLLPRFYDYTDGVIKLDGVPLTDYSRAYLRSQIGIVEQEPFLFSRSIRENITYGVARQVSDAEVEAAARAAAVHDVILTFPKGYETLVGERGVTLSGGQKQRIAIARTLLKNPRILILDDATSSVDTETEAEINDAMDRLMENRTTFIIAHRVHSVMNADLILVLEDGKIAQHGTHAELMAQTGFYRQIYDVQSRIEAELEKEIASV